MVSKMVIDLLHGSENSCLCNYLGDYLKKSKRLKLLIKNKGKKNTLYNYLGMSFDENTNCVCLLMSLLLRLFPLLFS